MLAGRLWPNGEVWAGHLARPSGMGLVNLRKNHNLPRGRNGITAHGRRTIRQAAYLLEDYAGRADLSFLTCSLPGDTLDECRAANEAWPEICRRFLQELRRELLRKRAPAWFVGCTEIQPKRLARTGQPWPHLHLIFVGKTGKPWLIGPKRATILWARVVNAVLKIPLDRLQWATTIKPLQGKKSAGQYLAKYMSKGKDDVEAIKTALPEFPLPRAWHHCSHELNELVRMATVTLPGATAAWVIKLFQVEQPGAKLFKAISAATVGPGDYDSPIGYYGCLDPPIAAMVIRHSRSSKNHDRI